MDMEDARRLPKLRDGFGFSGRPSEPYRLNAKREVGRRMPIPWDRVFYAAAALLLATTALLAFW